MPKASEPGLIRAGRVWTCDTIRGAAVGQRLTQRKHCREGLVMKAPFFLSLSLLKSRRSYPCYYLPDVTLIEYDDGSVWQKP